MNKTLSLLALLALAACQAPNGGDEITRTEEDLELAASGVLFVVGNSTLVPADAGMKKVLAGLGLGVTVKSARAATTADASGRRLVVVSSTVASGDVNTKFRRVTVPVLTYESAILDDLGMTKAAAGTDYGTASSQTKLGLLVMTGDPMSAGLSGSPAVVTGPDTFSWGRPASAAVKVARLAGDASKFPIFRYEKGAQMFGLTAPERRVALFLGDATANVLTTAGYNLAEAAARWAARLPVKKGLGSACGTSADCASGACVEGVCCNSACTGTCASCVVAGKEGTCSPVPEGQDPRNHCTPAEPATCGTDGFCNGAGQCRLYVAGTACAPGTCSGSTESSASICNGTGMCTPGASRSCGDYLCSGVACGVTCTDDSQCIAGAHCWQGRCNRPCKLPRPDNLLATGGFDSFGEMTATWQSMADDRAGMGWAAEDVDGCAGSGSLYLYTNVSEARASRCVPALGDTDYYMGGKFKGSIITDWQPSCGVTYHASSDCSGVPLGTYRVQLASFVPAPHTWTSFAAGYRSPMGTRSIVFDCDVLDDIGQLQFTHFDQLFLTPNIPAF